jgi:glutamate/tyrosine decarboxylase-like PLP-dependent enzyme
MYENEIHKYRKISSSLEPEEGERQVLSNKVQEYTEEFINNIYSLPAYMQTDTHNIEIKDFNINSVKITINQILEIIKINIDKPGINAASGGHLGFIPGGGLFASAIGDWLSAIINKYSGVYFAAPGAIKLENAVIMWLCDLVGYPEESSGNLTSGGSIGNLIGIVTARDSINLKSRDFEKSVIYLTEQVHHSIRKSIKIAGLNDCIIREIQLDDKFKMQSHILEKTIINDKQNGFNPFLVVSTVGTTDTGSIDPINEISDICSSQKLWHHIDGAYGAFFILSDLVKSSFKGIERSDSVVMDPHKGLFLPYGSGSVIVRDKEKLLKSHYHTANYMQDALSRQEEISPADLSPEMSRHFRALRLWIPLKLAGLDAFKSALSEKILLARYFYEKIQAIEGFEVGNYPELSVVTFRFIPKYGDANKFNEQLINEILKDGRVFLSSTVINGNFTLRLAVLHFRTHIETIDLALKVLNEKVELLKNL